MAQNAMREAICRHRILLAASLLQSTNHLYWSDHELESKQNSLHAAAPFSQTLLQAERTFLELQPAVRSVEEFGDRFYAVRPSEAWTWLTEPERRVLEYTKTGCAFDRILRDPELDRLTCYRTVFLLWLTGHLRPHASVCSSEPARERVSLFTRIQSVPPEWIYPFLVGMLVGILAAPRPEPEMRTALSPKATERLQDMMQKPAWSSPQADSAPDPDQ